MEKNSRSYLMVKLAKEKNAKSKNRDIGESSKAKENLSNVDKYFEDSDDSIIDPNYEKSTSGDSLSSSSNNESLLNQEPLARPTEQSIDGQKKYSRKTIEDRKLRRQRGESYTTASGRTIPQRNMKDLSPCRMKCQQRFLKEDLQAIFNEYWNIENYDLKKSYLAGLIIPKQKATSRIRTQDPSKQKPKQFTYEYYLEINNTRENICKSCFLKVFDENKKLIENIQKKKCQSSSGAIGKDMRGQKGNARKHSIEVLQIIDDHINKFPSYESHYCRAHTSKKYLPSHLNLTKMYLLYKEEVSNPVSRTIYEKRFHKLNLSFKKPQIDTCHTCDLLKMKIEVANAASEQERLIEERNAHHKKVLDEKRKDKEHSAENLNHKVLAFDLQQCLPTPYLQTSVSFYKRKLWTYNLTVHDCTTKEATCFMWHEAVAARGANEIASCLYKFLLNLPENVTQITFYSDTCAGQNRNSYIAAMFMVALQRFPHISVIDHKFLVSGHSHMECDSDHSVIERLKKKTAMNIHLPRDWYQLVRSAGQRFGIYEMQKEDFFKFSEIYKTYFIRRKKNNENYQFLWSKSQWFRYKKPEGTLLYKESLDRNIPFHQVDMQRRGYVIENIEVPPGYIDSFPINKEKKKDLIDLLPLIDPQVHDFYINLKTNECVSDIDPDLVEFSEN